uniref:protein PFC0760c-like n=1 Tax=Styela clava TaxID=7725 RepID=UPI001939A7CD|nr:protein PFC0760c-like [Styela clava]
MKSWLLVTFFFCLEGGAKSELTNNWPTYEHPDYKGRLCYYCPPGFYLVEPCKHSYKSEPGYSNCKKCEKGTFSGRWNDDPNCWDSEVCSIDRVKLFDGESTGPTICTCNSSSVVKNGECELGISKREHEALMLRQKRSFVCPVTTCPPCPDCPTKAKMKPLPTCPPCKVTNPTIEADNHQQVILGIFLALFICLFLGVVRAYIILYRKNKKLKNKHKKDVEQGQSTRTSMQDFSCQTIDENNVVRTNRDGSNISRSSDNLTSSQSNTEPLSSHASTSPIPQQKNQKSKQDKKIEESELERDSLKNENERSKRSSMKLEKIVLPKDRSIIEDSNLDEAFRIIASSVINRSFDFYQQTLKLDSDICMKMENDNEGRSMPFKITDGLSKWKQFKGSSATLDSLIILLRNGNRNDIADKIEKNLNINLEKEHTERHQEGVKIKDDKDSSIEDAFREIPKRFSNISNFKRFARSSRGLSLSSDEVENIFDSESRQSRKEKECQILELWKEKNGDEATTSKLRQLVNTFLNEDDESGQAFTNQTNDGNNSAEALLQTERFFTHEDGDADDKANPSENDCTQESGTTVAETVPKSHDQDATNSQETRPKVHSNDIPTSSAHSDMRVEFTKESNQTEEEGLGIEPDENGDYTVKSNDDDEVYEDVDHNEEDPTGTSGDHDKTSDKKTEKKKTEDDNSEMIGQLLLL